MRVRGISTNHLCCSKDFFRSPYGSQGLFEVQTDFHNSFVLKSLVRTPFESGKDRFLEGLIDFASSFGFRRPVRSSSKSEVNTILGPFLRVFLSQKFSFLQDSEADEIELG